MVGLERLRIAAGRQVDGWLLIYVADVLGDAFGREVEIASFRLDGSSGYDPRRGQYLAEPILQQMQPKPGEHMLGLVDFDVYAPPTKYIVGLADRPARRALVALPRLRAPGELGVDNYLARVAAEAMLQIGRTLEAEDPTYVQAVSAICSRVVGSPSGWMASPDTLLGGSEPW